jgi:hypothetical protein
VPTSDARVVQAAVNRSYAGNKKPKEVREGGDT